MIKQFLNILVKYASNAIVCHNMLLKVLEWSGYKKEKQLDTIRVSKTAPYLPF